jgi:hypothetical protein
LRWPISNAALSARALISNGTLKENNAEQYIKTSARVQLKGARKGWSEAKIHRRIKISLGTRKVWDIGKLIAPRPFGGALVSGGDMVGGIVDKIIARGKV